VYDKSVGITLDLLDLLTYFKLDQTPTKFQYAMAVYPKK